MRYKSILIAAIFVLFFQIITTSAIICPQGLVNDEYPGECGNYIDNNNDQICDSSQNLEATQNLLSKTNAELKDLIGGSDMKKKTVSEVADLYGIECTRYSEELSLLLDKKVTNEDSFQLLHDNYGLGPEAAKDIAIALLRGTSISKLQTENKEKQYYLEHIGLIAIILYLISFYFYKKGKFSVVIHRKIWNILLLFSFLGVGISGILLVIRVSYGFALELPFNLLFWHVETGIAMALISIFHISWHLNYFKTLIIK